MLAKNKKHENTRTQTKTTQNCRKETEHNILKHMTSTTAATTSVTRFDDQNIIIANYTEDAGRYCCEQCSYSCSSIAYLLQHTQVRHNCFSHRKVAPHPPVPHTHLYMPQDKLAKYWAPRLFIDQLLSFQSKKVESTKKITGNRRVVNLAGTDSKPWESFVRTQTQSARHNVEFLRAFQETAEDIARHSLPGNEDVIMSPDVLALIGAETQQTPHVDLTPGQFQIIMILAPTDGAISTLFYNAASPTHEEALGLLMVDPSSTSSFASVLKYAPALALPRNTIEARMSSISDGTSTAQRMLPQGSWIVADHTVVHAGPRQPQTDNNVYPRIVLFTTFTVSGTGSAAYNLKDQYMPAHFCEDPTMPADRSKKI